MSQVLIENGVLVKSGTTPEVLVIRGNLVGPLPRDFSTLVGIHTLILNGCNNLDLDCVLLPRGIRRIEVDKCVLGGNFESPLACVRELAVKFIKVPSTKAFKEYFPRVVFFEGDQDAHELCPEGIVEAKFMMGLPVPLLPGFLQSHPRCKMVNVRITSPEDVHAFIDEVYTKFPQLNYYGSAMILKSIFYTNKEYCVLYKEEIDKANAQDIEEDALSL